MPRASHTSVLTSLDGIRQLHQIFSAVHALGQSGENGTNGDASAALSLRLFLRGHGFVLNKCQDDAYLVFYLVCSFRCNSDNVSLYSSSALRTRPEV